MMMNILDRKLLLCATAFTALSLSACADESLDGTDESGEESAVLAQQSAPVTVPNPEGSYFASVVANGSGCPAGSWDVDISPDGQVFTATFSQYEVNITPQVPDATLARDCTLAIQLHSPQGLSYAITSFYYSGYAFLEQGVTARQSARYWFQGNPLPPTNSNRVDIVGPADRSFLFQDSIETKDQVYSACGTQRDLNVNTRLQVINSSPKRNGYANIASIDGKTELKFGITWRKCTAGSTTGATGGGVTRNP
jgi:hypothetical protein